MDVPRSSHKSAVSDCPTRLFEIILRAMYCTLLVQRPNTNDRVHVLHDTLLYIDTPPYMDRITPISIPRPTYNIEGLLRPATTVHSCPKPVLFMPDILINIWWKTRCL